MDLHNSMRNMNLLRVTLTLSLLVFACSTSSCLKNDPSEPSFDNGPNIIRRSRRAGLNEYLVPPPIPKPYPVRSGRVANPSAAESPGYFTQLMSWLNPFNYVSSTSTPLKTSPSLYSPLTQSYGPPPYNLHPALQPGPSLHPPLGPQIDPSLHSSIGPFPPVQHAGPLPPVQHAGPLPPVQHAGPLPSVQHAGPLPPVQHAGPLPPVQHAGPLPPVQHAGPPPPVQHAGPLPPVQHAGPLHPVQHAGPPVAAPSSGHPDASLNLPVRPSLQFYNPSTIFHGMQRAFPTPTDNRGSYVAANKGKHCNPCNKVPWIPMQDSGLHSDKYPLPTQLSNGYLPPSNQGNHDVQYAASHEIRIPELSQIPVEQTPFNSALPHPLLYHDTIPPLYKAEPFDRPFQNPPAIENVEHFKSPALPVTPLTDQVHKSPDVKDERYNIYGNDDQRSIGTEINQGHVSAISKSHEIEINKEPVDHKESFDSSILDAQSPGSSNLENHEFPSQSGNEYHELFHPNPTPITDFNYLPPDLKPSASFATSTFHNQESNSLNYQYSGDLSPSGSVVKDSHVTTQPSLVSSFVSKERPIHFEESPLLDLTKTDESRTDIQWPTSTIGYTDIDNVSDTTAKTTTDYNLETENVFFEDSSDSVKSTESYSFPDIQNINSVFGPSTIATVDFSNSNINQHVETSTGSREYTNQQDVSYIPPSGQAGYLWPSLLINTPNLRNHSSKNHGSLNHLARWNNSFSGNKNSEKQESIDTKDTRDTLQKPQNMKRNKQVQVIIPYTSEYTPIPFQQSYGDWSIKTNFERTQPRKVPSRTGLKADNYLQQESRNDIRVVNQFQSQFNVNNSKKLNVQSIRPSSTTVEDSKSTTRANTSIDVRRLQKNIDNWTIQEYSRPTTSSTILPSSLHPYLSPSKKIPTEYLTTTEPADRINESKDHNEIVKTYSLAGFSFNEIEHEGSASNRIEETQPAVKVVRIDKPKVTINDLHSVDKPAIEEKSTWKSDSVSISSINKERVYVVTPQPISQIPSKNDMENRKGQGETEQPEQTSESTTSDISNSKNNFSEFEAIEKAYQVLPQAVNNLAVASTGKENIPLWGIMEHEEFASLNLNENDEEAAEDIVDGPILYSGHSKVSRAKR